MSFGDARYLGSSGAEQSRAALKESGISHREGQGRTGGSPGSTREDGSWERFLGFSLAPGCLVAGVRLG